MKREQADREMQDAIRAEAHKQGLKAAAALFDGHAAMSGPLTLPATRLCLSRGNVTKIVADAFEAGWVAGKNTEREALTIVREQLARDRRRARKNQK